LDICGEGESLSSFVVKTDTLTEESCDALAMAWLEYPSPGSHATATQLPS